jgi:hypothetical protein
MTKIWTLIACFIANLLMAETIGDVKYQLPTSMQEWKITNKKIDKEQEAIDYAHETEDFSEFFFTSYNRGIGLNGDYSKRSKIKRMMEESIQPLFPNQKVEVTIIEQRPKSIFYKWTVRDDTREIVHGWTKEFLTSQGAITLRYVISLPTQANDAALRFTLKNIPVPKEVDIEKMSNPWIATLQGAKPIN